MKKRFNKQNVLDHIAYKIKALEDKWKFDPYDGWAQVEGTGFHKVMAYGEYQVLNELLDEITYGSLEEVK